MKLRFIGRDGSMGLIHGNIYDVHIVSGKKNRLIWASWRFDMACPYSSMAAFMANWEDVKEKKT